MSQTFLSRRFYPFSQGIHGYYSNNGMPFNGSSDTIGIVARGWEDNPANRDSRYVSSSLLMRGSQDSSYDNQSSEYGQQVIENDHGRNKIGTTGGGHSQSQGRPHPPSGAQSYGGNRYHTYTGNSCPSYPPTSLSSLTENHTHSVPGGRSYTHTNHQPSHSSTSSLCSSYPSIVSSQHYPNASSYSQHRYHSNSGEFTSSGTYTHPHPSYHQHNPSSYKVSNDAHMMYDMYRTAYQPSRSYHSSHSNYRRTSYQPYGLPEDISPSSDSSPPASIQQSPRHASYSRHTSKQDPTLYPSNHPSETPYVDIVSHPEDTIVCLEGKLTLVCDARILNSNDKPVYQWYKDEEPLIGEVDGRFEKAGVVEEDLGFYFCVVSDVSGRVQRKSRDAFVQMSEECELLTVAILGHCAFDSSSTTPCSPLILGQPDSDVEIMAGERLSLKLHVQAVPEPTYRWFRNGMELQYANGPELVVPCATVRDEGQYICSVKNDWGSVLSQPILVQLVSKSRRSETLESSSDIDDSQIALPPSYIGSKMSSPSLSPVKKTFSPPSSLSSPSHGSLGDGVVSDNVLSIVSTQLQRQMDLSGFSRLAFCLGLSAHELASVRVHYSTLADKVMQVLLIWKRHAPSPDERSLEDLLQSNGFRVSIPYSTGHGGPPVILRHPESVQTLLGNTAMMEVILDPVTTGDVHYQWYKDGVSLSGETSSELFFPHVQETSRGLYFCSVRNCYGSVNSHPARVDIIPNKIKLPPSFQPPHHQGNQPSFLYISPTEKPLNLFSPLVGYQDPLFAPMPRKGSGDTGSLPSLDSLSSSHQFAESGYGNNGGGYSVGVAGVSERLGNMRLMESTKPVILEHPRSQQLSLGDQLQLNIVIRGQTNVKYCWYFNGLALPQENLDEFYLNCFTEEDVGDYYCKVSNENGTTTSDIAVVTLKEDDEDNDEDNKYNEEH